MSDANSIIGASQSQDEGAIRRNESYGRLKVFEVEPGAEIKNVDKSIGALPNNFLFDLKTQIAAGFGVSYTRLFNDASKSNFAAARVAIKNDRACYAKLQKMLIGQVALPLFKRWITINYLPLALSADTYELLMKRASFTMEDPGSVDPRTELSDVEKLDNNLISFQEYHDKQGRDWQEVIDQKVEAKLYERQKMKELDLVEDDENDDNSKNME